MDSKSNADAGLIPEDMGAEVIANRKVLFEGRYELCKCPVLLIVEQCEVTCPVPMQCPPTLRIIGDFPEVSISTSDKITEPELDGCTIAFGKTRLEFEDGCKAFTMNGENYEPGPAGEGFCYELGDGLVIAVYRDHPAA